MTPIVHSAESKLLTGILHLLLNEVTNHSDPNIATKAQNFKKDLDALFVEAKPMAADVAEVVAAAKPMVADVEKLAAAGKGAAPQVAQAVADAKPLVADAAQIAKSVEAAAAPPAHDPPTPAK